MSDFASGRPAASRVLVLAAPGGLLMPHDEGNHMLAEHTCRGLDTCAGYSCVIPC